MRTLLAIAVLMLAPLAGAETLDRIAVSVGNRVITQADLDREIRITAFLNSEKPDFSASNKRRTAERMVDQRLVRSELEVSRYLLPTAADAEESLKEIRSRYANEATFNRALAEYNITSDDLKARLLWQLALIRFIDLRFRPGVQIGDAQIQKYFDEQLRPSFEKEHPGVAPTVDQYRDDIERILISQEADQQVEQWLRQARRRTRILYHDEVLQ